MVMVDLHCHLLPRVDDGSKSMEVSLRMAREAVANGVTHALLTPHHLNGRYVNHKQDVVRETKGFQKALDKQKIPLMVFPGQEVRINGNLLKALDEDDILFADTGNRYLMLEFAYDDVPHYTKQMIFDLQGRGITPVIVHPERNTMIMDKPEKLLELLENSCLAQITASSYVGTFGKRVEQFSRQLIAAGQCNVFASDAHDLPGRKYEMREAFSKLANEFGGELVDRYQANARAIINGENVPLNQLREVKKKKRFWLF
jgi:protein-tyrosine phosphatase